MSALRETVTRNSQDCALTPNPSVGGSATARELPQAEERRAILRWLARDCAQHVFVEDILPELGDRLLRAGIPVSQASMVFAVDHPRWLAARILWKPRMREAELKAFEHGSLGSIHYQGSFVQFIHDGCDTVRNRIEELPAGTLAHPFIEELRRDGVTDFMAWLLAHTQGRRHVATFSTNRPGGFAQDELDFIETLIPVLALVTEVRLKNRFVRTLLETYVGPHASREILAGAVTRGSGRTVGAGILVCDLRGFSRLAERLPQEDVVEALNGFFDAVGEPIEVHGGEVLKFMGDGLLAIFPTSRLNASANLLQAVRAITRAIDRLNEARSREAKDPLRYGVGAHIGDVLFGNIGLRGRLDFTVIGPAVNVASRLEGLTRTLGRPVLFSKSFVDSLGIVSGFDDLGSFPLGGMDEPVRVFALASV